jgi:hypothetical protein
MINPGTPRPPLPRRWWFAFVIGFALVLTAGFLRPELDPDVPDPDVPAPVAAPSRTGPPVPVAAVPEPPKAPEPSISSTTVSVPTDLLSLPGAVPVEGAGTFGHAPGRGRILGTKGPMRRFRVAVERGGREDVAVFAAQVETTLGDKRGWTGGGRLRLQRVGRAQDADFTIYLATRETAGRMCARGGVNIRVGGRPYTSCRAAGKVVINLDRWRLSAPPYTAAKVPLITYRQYLINHEVGHEFGHGHQGCPRRGGPAPVMVQQTLTLRGCTPNAWPRRGIRDLAGPNL